MHIHYFKNNVYVCACITVGVYVGIQDMEEDRASDPLELESYSVVSCQTWMLETEVMFSERSANALN